MSQNKCKKSQSKCNRTSQNKCKKVPKNVLECGLTTSTNLRAWDICELATGTDVGLLINFAFLAYVAFLAFSY